MIVIFDSRLGLADCDFLVIPPSCGGGRCGCALCEPEMDVIPPDSVGDCGIDASCCDTGASVPVRTGGGVFFQDGSTDRRLSRAASPARFAPNLDCLTCVHRWISSPKFNHIFDGLRPV